MLKLDSKSSIFACISGSRNWKEKANFNVWLWLSIFELLLSYWFDLDEGQNTTCKDDQKETEISQSQNVNYVSETFLI